MSTYLEYRFEPLEEGYQEIIVAYLSEFAFDTFQEQEDGTLSAFVKEEEMMHIPDADVQASVASFARLREKNRIAEQNWNQVWEQQFEPMEIEGLCRVCAPFHEAKNGFAYQIVIQPRMAFGTGHHPTTRMMIKMMSGLDFSNKHVLDFGCGTGILSVFASKLGASTVLGLDIESWSVENSEENARLNGIENAHFSGKPIQHCVDEGLGFDVILANIQLDVLSNHSEVLKSLLEKNKGLLLLSGVMVQFEEVLQTHFEKAGFELLKEQSEDIWICHLYRFKGPVTEH